MSNQNKTGCKLCDDILEAQQEAERDTWHEDGDGKFRKGRWTVRLSGVFASIGHDDFPDQWYSDAAAHVGGVIFVRQAHKMRAEFRAWHAATYPPKPVVSVTPWAEGDGVTVKLTPWTWDLPRGFVGPLYNDDPNGTALHAAEDYFRDNPPGPDEPAGLGAVVEAGGVRFVRTSTNNPWWTNGDAGVLWGHIDQFGKVTVLSEGITAGREVTR